MIVSARDVDTWNELWGSTVFVLDRFRGYIVSVFEHPQPALCSSSTAHFDEGVLSSY